MSDSRVYLPRRVARCLEGLNLGVRIALGAGSVRGDGSDGGPRVRAVDAGTRGVDREDACDRLGLLGCIQHWTLVLFEIARRVGPVVSQCTTYEITRHGALHSAPATIIAR